MNIIAAIAIGFLAGLLARFFTPGKDSLGFIITTLLGIVGAFVGALIGQTMGWYAEGQPAGFFMSVMGAILVLFVAKKATGSKNITD